METTAESITPAELARELEGLPAVTGAPAAPAPAAAPAAPAGEPWVARDGLGRVFDPLYHECTLNGQPVTTSDQLVGVDFAKLAPRFRSHRDIKPNTVLAMRRRPLSAARLAVRLADPPPSPPAPPVNDAPTVEPADKGLRSDAPPSGAQAGAVDASSTGAPPPVIADDAPAPEAPATSPASEAEKEQTAQLLAGVQLMIMRNALGAGVDHVEGRLEALQSGWRRVLDRYGMDAMGPWTGLALATGGIVVTAYTKHEDTRGRLSRGLTWCKVKLAGWWVGWKARRAARVAAA